MTDPFDGYHGPRRSAPPGGADRAISVGRRRLVRRRTATTAAGVSVAVVAGAALSGFRDGGSHGLDPADRPGPGRTEAAATATPSIAVPTTPPLTVPTLPPVTGTTSPSPDPGTSPDPEPAEEPTPERGRFIGVTPGTVQTQHRNDPSACTNVPEQAAWIGQSGFCVILTGPREVTPGDAASFSVSLCRPNGMPARTVTFESDYEVEINVAVSTSTGERAVWTWADREGFAPRRHTVTFDAGDCRTWTAAWNGQDNDGYALAAGHYQVNGYPFGYDWTHEDGDDGMGPAPQFYTIEVTD